MREKSEVEKLVDELAYLKRRFSNLRGLEAGLNLQYGASIQKRRIIFNSSWGKPDPLTEGEAIELANYLRFKQGELDDTIREIENKLTALKV